MKRFPVVAVISGPSGVGKDATISRMMKGKEKIHYVVTATTRARRPNEINGIDYYFLTEEEFNKKVENDEFLEYARVYNNLYGVLKSEVRHALEKGQDVIIKVDVQGAATLKNKIPNAIFIFLEPPSIDDLHERLKNRKSDSEHSVNMRLSRAEEEMSLRKMFDHTVINNKGDLDKTANTVKKIINQYRGKRGKVIV